MTIRFKLAGMQGLLLLTTLLLLGTLLVILSTSITPLANRLSQDVDALSKMSAEEKFTLTMVSSRRDLQQGTADYIHAPNELTKTKYNFAAIKLQEAINRTLRNSKQGTGVFNIYKCGGKQYRGC